MMPYFLDEVRAHVLKRVAAMRVDIQNHNQPADFCSIFRDACKPEILPSPSGEKRQGATKFPAIISEIKFASPSRGTIYHGDLNPVQIANEYLQHGASALSILTEPDFFKGDIDYIRQIRAAIPSCPILLKDFVLAPIQIQQAHAFGANAVLLIVGFLDQVLLHELYAYAVSLGLTPLIEVHDADELARALTLNPKIIGINNRNLKTLTIDLETSRTLIQLIPDDVFAVCESGITSLAQIQSMMALGFDGFLIGSHMMQTNHPGKALRDLLLEPSHES